MKCDELKVYEDIDGYIGYDDTPPMMYDKSEVDAAIAELKAENAELIAELKRKEAVEQRWFEGCMEARAENVRLKRALWLARAERARDNSILLPSKFMRNVWDNVECKCRSKADKFKEAK